MAESSFVDPPRGMISARAVPSRAYGSIALTSLGALVMELFVGFSLSIAPGWANGWLEGRLSIHEVWSSGMTLILFVILITGSIFIGALLGLLLSRLAIRRPLARMVVILWLIVSAILAFLITCLLHESIYLSSLEMWPNGYNP